MTAPLLTARDAATINEARDILRAAIERSRGERDARADLYRIGQVAGIMEQAEESLFAVLNWTHAFGLGSYSDAVVQNRTPETVA